MLRHLKCRYKRMNDLRKLRPGWKEQQHQRGVKGLTADARLCLECGEPLPIPHNALMKRHTQCKVKRLNSLRKFRPEWKEQQHQQDVKRWQKHREQQLAYNRRHTREVRLEALSYYGGECACCGESRFEFLAFDHINGGGSAHRRAIRTHSGQRFATWLKKQGWPLGFRVLCHNCNQALGHYGFCPHQIADPSATITPGNIRVR